MCLYFQFMYIIEQNWGHKGRKENNLRSIVEEDIVIQEKGGINGLDTW